MSILTNQLHEEDRPVIEKMKRDGYPARIIAERFGVNTNSIYHFLKKKA